MVMVVVVVTRVLVGKGWCFGEFFFLVTSGESQSQYCAADARVGVANCEGGFVV